MSREMQRIDRQSQPPRPPPRPLVRRRRHVLLSLLLSPVACADALLVTTFNVLAAVHRSMPPTAWTTGAAAATAHPEAGGPPPRESERREWWGPRAEGLARYVAQELSSSDVVLLQEWWFCEEFEELFDRHTSHIFNRVAERRPGREDGMAILIKKTGKLRLLNSSSVLTGPQRIAQIAQCRERGEGRRRVTIANAHLSFPGGPDPVANARRQAMEVQIAARALDSAAAAASAERDGDDEEPDERRRRRRGRAGRRHHLQIIAGDFNSDSRGLAASRLEASPRWGYVNSATATANLVLSGGAGGRINLGVTHRTHRGEDVSVDHVFVRTVGEGGVARRGRRRRARGQGGGRDSDALCRSSGEVLRGLGYLDSEGTRISFCSKKRLKLEGDEILSDHRPVTACLEWATSTAPTVPNSPTPHWGRQSPIGAVPAVLPEMAAYIPSKSGHRSGGAQVTTLAALHPLQSPWDTP